MPNRDDWVNREELKGQRGWRLHHLAAAAPEPYRRAAPDRDASRCPAQQEGVGADPKPIMGHERNGGMTETGAGGSPGLDHLAPHPAVGPGPDRSGNRQSRQIAAETGDLDHRIGGGTETGPIVVQRQEGARALLRIGKGEGDGTLPREGTAAEQAGDG